MCLNAYVTGQLIKHVSHVSGERFRSRLLENCPWGMTPQTDKWNSVSNGGIEFNFTPMKYQQTMGTIM